MTFSTTPTLFDLTSRPLVQPPPGDSDQWGTPGGLLELARRLFGGTIDLDPASNLGAQQRVRASRWFDRAQDGLKQHWAGNVWLNPPYSGPAPFVEKLLSSHDVSQALVLVNNQTDARWFHLLLERTDRMLLLLGRIAFINAEEQEQAGARQGQALFYLGHSSERFEHLFGHLGVVLAATSSIKRRPVEANDGPELPSVCWVQVGPIAHIVSSQRASDGPPSPRRKGMCGASLHPLRDDASPKATRCRKCVRALAWAVSPEVSP